MKLYSIAQASELTTLSAITLRRAIARGDLEFVQLGRRIAVRAEALEAFVKARCRRGRGVAAAAAETGGTS